jgi:outer membrane protein assembly factor BamB
LVAAFGLAVPHAAAQWQQWGGPGRNFVTTATGLAAAWPESGPKKLWSHPLGEGYSSILFSEGNLYTMYRNGDEEVITALKAGSGETVWEYKYAAPVPEGMETRFGNGPNSTPLVTKDQVCALGVAGHLHCLDRSTGKLAWSHELIKEYSAKAPEFGFSSSPMAVNDRLIVAGSGEGCGLLAFELATGKLLWKKHDFENVYSSPILVDAPGGKQFVLLTDREVVGMDTESGDKKWSHKHQNQWNTNISTPVWGPDGLLFVTAGGEAGSRCLKVAAVKDEGGLEEAWANGKIGIGQGNAIRVGDTIYACAGHSPTFITAVNAKTGDTLWQERGFAKAMLLYADGKLIILDENGTLALAAPDTSGLNVKSKTKLSEKRTWTVPTLVGKTLYLRDTERIMALDLG